MRRTIVQLFCWGWIVSGLNADPLCDLTFEAVSNYYSRVAQKIAPKHAALQTVYFQPITPKAIIEEEHFSYIGPVLNIQMPLRIIVRKKTAEVIALSNYLLYTCIETNVAQKVPVLTIPEVVKRAKSYMTDCEVSIPDNCQLKIVAFNANYRSQWEVIWVPVVDEYTYDEFMEPYSQSLTVCFHEEYGFCGFSCLLNFPPPKNTEVKITKEDAIARASKVAPLVMKTPFYKMARASGFKVTGVKKAELKIAAPNWLLDPARAVWIREKPPEETRLCWIVTLGTVDTIDRGEIKLNPVDILVYIDAATGEVVGANFS